MARMHSRAKGKSGSTKPSKVEKPLWVRYSDKEVEQLIVKLGKNDKSASEIGLILRDTYGIPSVKILTGKKIQKILDEHKLTKDIPEDLMNLIRISVKLRNHMGNNKHDMTARRGLEIADSKIKRLSDYYIKKGKLPKDWKFDPEKVKLLVE